MQASSLSSIAVSLAQPDRRRRAATSLRALRELRRMLMPGCLAPLSALQVVTRCGTTPTHTRMVRRLAVASSLIVLFAAGGIRVIGARDRDQQTPPAVAPTPTPSPTPKVDEEDGTPITSGAVKTACGDCHSEDAKHRFTRISYRRTTPEGWQETIRRMVTLNKASIEPDRRARGREVPLRPSRPRAGRSEAGGVRSRSAASSTSSTRQTPTPSSVCSSCHSMGRVMLQRRTARGVEPAGRHAPRLVPARRLPGVPPRRAARHRARAPTAGRRTIGIRWTRRSAHLKSAFPLTTPEWTAWSATMRSPQLDGTWALNGLRARRGPDLRRR